MVVTFSAVTIDFAGFLLLEMVEFRSYIIYYVAFWKMLFEWSVDQQRNFLLLMIWFVDLSCTDINACLSEIECPHLSDEHII